MSGFDNVLTLLKNVTADGNGEYRYYAGTEEGTLDIDGTFDGATVTIQGRAHPDSTFKAPAASAYTSAIITSYEGGIGHVRAVVSGAGASTNLSVYLSPQDRS